MRPARLDLTPVRELLRELRVEELPQREQRQEIGPLVAEHEMRLVGGLLLRERPIPRVRDRERACDDEHLGHAATVARGEHHAPDARVDGQPRELAAQ